MSDSEVNPDASPETIHVYPAGLSRFVNDLLVDRFPDTKIIHLEDEAAFIAAVPEIEIFFGLHHPKGHWGDAKRLRLIQVPGAGVDSVLPDSSIADEVVICNSIGVHEPEMPEFIVGLLFAITKKIPTLIDRQRNHEWKIVIPTTLSGMTACVVGLGTIGQSVARRLKALDMKVTGVRRSGAPVVNVDQVVTPEHRDDVLASADVAIVVTPKTPETEGLIGATEIAKMPSGSWLIDVSRGGVVDLDAVVAALESGHLAGAAVDVFPNEPIGEDSPLWDVPGLLVTPHTAGFSSDYFERTVNVLVSNLNAMSSGTTLTTPIDRNRGY